MLLLSLFLAFLPSLVWLTLFLREDVHPEPNNKIIRVFIAGMIITVPTIMLQAILHCALLGDTINSITNPETLSSISRNPCMSSPLLLLPEPVRQILFLFLGIALVEEILKYVAVRATILRDKNFDEPIDALLYLVIAALGFAAVENALTVSNAVVQNIGLLGNGGVLNILGARSLSATLLHTLTSGIVGYALAISFFSSRPRHFTIAIGIIIATLIHGAYNGIISGMLGSSGDIAIVGNIVLLLLVTGGILLIMLRSLRAASATHRWLNRGNKAEEVL